MASKEPCYLGIVAGGSIFHDRRPLLSVGMIKGEIEFDVIIKPTDLLTGKKFLDRLGLTITFQQAGVDFKVFETLFIKWVIENNVKRGESFIVSGNHIYDQLVLYDTLTAAINWTGFPFNHFVNVIEMYNERIEKDDRFKEAFKLLSVVTELNMNELEKPVTGIKIARQVRDIYLNLKNGVMYEEV